MLLAMVKEIALRKDELPDKTLKSIYLGGGTPSVLDAADLTLLFKTLEKYYSWSTETEITLEANPDDLNTNYLKVLQDSPVNRLSIGLQSLDQDQLEWMNRSHTAEQSRQVLKKVIQHGFRDITVDWMYGYPGLTIDQIEMQLNWMRSFGIPHFSAYALTIEPKTVLAHRVNTGKEPLWDDELSTSHFNCIMDWAAEWGYEHYEISNFAKVDRRAVHNSSYWNNEPYLGIGPSAHSYIESTRKWNTAHNAHYMKALEDGELKFEEESLSKRDQYNEWVMTNLRLKEGLAFDILKNRFPEYQNHFNSILKKQDVSSMLEIEPGHIKLNRKGKYFADRIAAAFFA
jgi:oxygen-independent coproporphyrinogen-3 oxidase